MTDQENGSTTTQALKITPLGGLGEIGLNCQLWEYDDQIAMIDCGLMFPDDSHLGVDVLIPHFGAMRAIKDKLRGIVLTHGHEDHIGALPWILPELKGTKIYGSRFTLALVRKKLEEFGLEKQAELIAVKAGDAVSLGGMTFHFFPVCHSIPHGFGLGVETPVGKVIHSGDFKIDPAPLDGPGTNMDDFRQFAGDKGVRLLLSDSTNVMREGFSLTEREVRDSLDKIFAAAPGRIIVTLFSSHIQRIQEVCDLSAKYGRSVIISGKSLASNIDIASSLGDLALPPDFHNAFYGVPDLPDDKITIIVTGAQGEPLSALSRMARGDHKQLSIQAGDTVVMSSRVIPGNARPISKMINDMFKLGAEVHYEQSRAVHASGHAHREELREMIMAARPEYFLPIHGEYQHLVMHARLAEECGVEKGRAMVLENGQPLTLDRDGGGIGPSVPVNYTLVDGKGVGDVGASVLKERRILGEEGVVIVDVILDENDGSIIKGPEITSRGFVYEQQLSYLLEDAKCLVIEQIELNPHPARLRENIKHTLRRFFRDVLERDPLIVPVVAAV
ncbi:MAG: ribonuclease J [Desulfovibrio sp.]|nr:ribonuclease J [Desulfovibrio sp.]